MLPGRVPEVHKLFCRLTCFNNVYKSNILNVCRCHPECRRLNYDPHQWSTTYSLFYNKRDCSCVGGACRRIHPQ